MAVVYAHLFPNDKLYIGISSKDDARKRWGTNGKGYENQKIVNRAIQKYGWDNILHIVLIENVSMEVAEECEKYLISKYNTQSKECGYNLCAGGRTNLGYHHTEEYKKNLSKWMKGRYKGKNNPSYGVPKTSDTREAISNALKGRKQSEDTCQKRSASLTGHIVNSETRQKISKGNKGKKRSSKYKKELSARMKGRTVSLETRKKMSEAHKGKPRTEETKQKIRATQLRRRECLSSVKS